ncbi:MAG: beta-N-acetylglucosaminidase domain-containing protein, partial [Clostridia bacterium]|nr:beta-N-acetylglucosaminidase domain-containing protein [Clostridia bacterium]
MVTIEDWSDSIYRGFIEGYYGIPWTTDDRIELMRFGGDFKTNVYIYAPKNDPYHSTNWRSLYSEADLQEIKEQVKAGEQTKTRFVWAAHPFNHAAILPDDKYRSGIDALLAKFDQLYQVGVRQFVVSADDVDGDTVGAANRWNTDLARDILNDVANWCKKKGDCYNTIFVP